MGGGPGPPVTTGDPKPWERQNQESFPAFEAFLQYKDLGAERSTSKVARRLAKSRQLIERWCRIHEWVRRADQWDWHLNDIKTRAQENEVVDMGRRQAKVAQALQAALQLPIQELVRRYQGDPTILQKLSDEDLLQLLIRIPRSMLAAVNVERTARGVPNEPVPVAAEDAVSQFRIILEEPATQRKKPTTTVEPIREDGR